MTDHEFLTAMRIKDDSAEEVWLQDADPLTEALRIDDLRSTYCEQLEKRIAQQALEIEVLRRLARLKRQGHPARQSAARFESIVKKIPGWLLPGLMVLVSIIFISSNSSAQPEYTKKEHVRCVVCHEGAWSSGKYTAAGQYYMEHHTFKGFRPAKPADQKQLFPLSVTGHAMAALPFSGRCSSAPRVTYKSVTPN